MQRGAIFGVVLVASGKGGNNRCGQASGGSPSDVTGGKDAVSGAGDSHFRRRFHRSSDSTCKIEHPFIPYTVFSCEKSCWKRLEIRY